MAPKSTELIEAAVRDELAGTAYAASSLRPLTGGTANFIYHVRLQVPLPDGTAEVVVKHGEAYVAQHPDFALTMSRCEIEEESLRFLSRLPESTSPDWAVGTPKLLHFDPNTSTQVQEYLPNAMSLKQYALEHYKAPTPASLKPQCLQLGRCLGEWLRRFHDWSDGPDSSRLREIFGRNTEMQGIKKLINYDRLPGKADEYPHLLQRCKDTLQGVADMAASELRDETSLGVIHGDFWTGNVLLPNKTVQEGVQTPVKIVDWEMAQLGVRPEDVGQIMAELWQLKLFKDIDAGTWILEGLADGYGATDADFAYRAIIHVGAHLICIGSGTPGWGTPEQAEKVVEVGRDVILAARKKDRRAFDSSVLACLFQ